jgi:sigma-B regulation protein RsbU (phosphoserine phosphatase)
MNDPSGSQGLTRQEMEQILAVTRALAAPFDLRSMLATVAAAARQVLRAERSSVWLHDAPLGELVLEIASDLAAVRIPVGTGLVGACARDRLTINVPDCYADPRFDAAMDRRSGFRTRCSVTLPLVDPRGALVGVMQVLNKEGGVFDDADVLLAEALAAQCAVALSRVRMTEALIEGERLRQELELARQVQQSTLPAAMPVVSGYDMHAHFQPAEQTGGDTYDLALVAQGLLVVLADATGHGIAPALAVTQMQAMLRMALRLGSDLPTAFREVNDRLAETLPDDRFITAFVGLLDPGTHRLRFLSGGQGPVLHFHAGSGACDVLGPTSFPMGAMPLARPRPPVELALAPGDWVVLLSDGIYETTGPDGSTFGEARVIDLVRAHGAERAEQLSGRLLDAVRDFAQGGPQADDITLVVVKREAGDGA